MARVAVVVVVVVYVFMEHQGLSLRRRKQPEARFSLRPRLGQGHNTGLMMAVVTNQEKTVATTDNSDLTPGGQQIFPRLGVWLAGQGVLYMPGYILVSSVIDGTDFL